MGDHQVAYRRLRTIVTDDFKAKAITLEATNRRNVAVSFRITAAAVNFTRAINPHLRATTTD
ncbi:hypothetical protein KGM_211053 [Danaus plexippus plexippus]|uniref:Uncharacterized protein n=1 Tax=Danaus plexippus plexippus TaxID=278856 RepID=A0A212EX58_DANPL|nr:hypothetical protein KGM_211053 [Danaus plexippus plexippus]